jgi:hypothetical protein
MKYAALPRNIFPWRGIPRGTNSSRDLMLRFRSGRVGEDFYVK